MDRAAALNAIQSHGAVGKSWPMGDVQPLASISREAVPRMPIARDVGVANSRRDGPGSVVPEGGQVSDTFSTHVMCNVDRMHAAGFTGAGIRIAVIDSGFDTTVHAFGETKIEYAVDVTSNSTIVNDNCATHGTHVLSIVGAKSTDNLYGVSGVAPDATFDLYKVDSCKGGTGIDVLIDAFIKAAHRGADVITCSYGGTGGFPEEPWGLAAGRIAANGTFVSVSAGNSGPGPFTGARPATGKYVTAVGAADNTLDPCIQWRGSMTMGGNTEELFVTPGQNVSFPDTPLTVWSPAKMETTERPLNCSFVQTEPPQDPANTIVLLKGSSQCWVDSEGVPLLSSTKYNLTYALFYNPEVPEGQVELCPEFKDWDGKVMHGIAATNHTTGSAIQAELSRGGQVKVTVPNDLANSGFSLKNPQGATAGLLSSFSSWGPSFDGRLMPAFVAPGAAILGAFPGNIGSWGVLSGTSMSTPYAAGVAALLKQYNRNLTAAQIQTKMVTTARPIKYNDRVMRSVYPGKTEDFPASVLHQGGGLVDAWAAAHTKTLLNVSNLSFNDTAHRPARLFFEISNTGDEELRYHMSNIGAASGVLMNKTGGARYNLTNNMGTPVFALLKFDPQNVTIGPGKTASVAVSVEAEPVLEGGVAYFGGYVALNVSTHNDASAESLTLPYTGIKGALASLPMVNGDLTYAAAYNITSDVLQRIEPGRVFTCEHDSKAQTPCNFVPDGLVPSFSISLVTQTRNMTVDLVNRGTGAVVLPAEFVNNETIPWPDGNGGYWNATDLNSSFVPPGNYFWRIKALRLNADSGTGKDWDVWESTAWTLNYTANSTGLPPHKRKDPLPFLRMRRNDDGGLFHLF